jgi:outer membrane protein assembly factor BamD
MKDKFNSSYLTMFFMLSLFFSLHFLATGAAGNILSEQQSIESLIKADRLTDAQARIEQLKVDYSKDSQLPYVLYGIGRRYEWSDKYNEARNVYQQIIQNHTDSPYANKARLGLARENAFSLIISGNYSQAENVVNKLETDFAGDFDLPDTLFWIGRRYEWSGKYDMANNIYQKIIQNHSSSSYADRARLGLARENAFSLIVSGDYSQAEQVVSKLETDFAGNSDLPDTLYWIGRRYEWSDKYDRAKNIYQKIVQNYSSSSYADKAKLSLARENIFSLIISGKYDQAEQAIDKLKTDFAGNSDLLDTLYYIGERYRWGKQYEKAKLIYGQIVQDYPNSRQANKAKLGIARVNVLSLIAAQKYDDAEQAFDKLIIDFSGHPDLLGTLYWIADDYQWVKEYEKAKLIYEQMVQNYPDSQYASKAKLGAARMEVTSLIESGHYQRAREAFVKLLADFSTSTDLPKTLSWIAEKYEEAGETEAAKKIFQNMILDYRKKPEIVVSARAHLTKYELYSAIEASNDSTADAIISQLGAELEEPSKRYELLVSIAKRLDMKSAALNVETENSALAANYALKVISILENQVLSMNPSAHFRMEAYYHLAECYRRLDIPSTAREYYQKFFDVKPQDYLACYAKHMVARCMEQETELGLISESEAISKMREIHQNILSDYPSCEAVEYAQDWLDKNTH